MSWHRGLQSAIFWYASCAPCVEARYEKQRKKDAMRGRELREQLANEIPGMYRHPSPAATNPHWQTEIDAGPHLTMRGRKYANRDRTRDIGREQRRRGLTQSSDASGLPSSIDVSLNGSGDGRVDSKLHFQQFQRDDEQGPLNQSTVSLRTASDGMSSRSNITRPRRALMADDPSYVHNRNPQINDLHPATVTRIASREEAKWLLAPQPTADFMEGKDPTCRSRSDSGGSSRLSGRTPVPLSRELSQRMMGRRMKDGDIPLVPSMSRGSTSQGPNSPKSQIHDRDNVEEKDFALDESPRIRPRGSSLLGQSWIPEQSEDSTLTVTRKPDSALEPMSAPRLSSRPKLSTIDSSGIMPSEAQVLKENIRSSDDSLLGWDRTEHRSPLLTEDESLKALRELAPHSKIFKSHILSEEDLTIATKAGARRDPDLLDDEAEMVDSFFSMDFSSPDWIHEHTKREVNHRWSMDI